MPRNLPSILLAALLFALLAATFSAAYPLDSTPPRYSILHAGAKPASPSPGLSAATTFAAPELAPRGGGGAIPPTPARPSVQALELEAQGVPGDLAEPVRQRQWRWRRVGGMEYAGIAVGAVVTVFSEYENGKPIDPFWTSRNAFDEEIRSALRLESRSSRDAAEFAGDAIMALMIAAPVVDSFATLGIRDGNWDALWQTEMVNLEAFTLTSLLSSLPQSILARERPYLRDCEDGKCDSRLANRSFPSGHVAFAFTGAGLLCNHHWHQGLYRDARASRAVCGTGIGLAVADGVLRIASDEHYATDVIAGTAIGLFSGFVLPRLLHYNHPTRGASAGKKSGASPIKGIRFSPLLTGNATGLSCEFRF